MMMMINDDDDDSRGGGESPSTKESYHRYLTATTDTWTECQIPDFARRREKGV